MAKLSGTWYVERLDFFADKLQFFKEKNNFSFTFKSNGTIIFEEAPGCGIGRTHIDSFTWKQKNDLVTLDVKGKSFGLSSFDYSITYAVKKSKDRLYLHKVCINHANETIPSD